MAGKNPLWPVLWLILLIWIAWPVAMFCASIWIILQVRENKLMALVCHCLWRLPNSILFCFSDFLALWSMLRLCEEDQCIFGKIDYLASWLWSCNYGLLSQLSCSLLSCLMLSWNDARSKSFGILNHSDRALMYTCWLLVVDEIYHSSEAIGMVSRVVPTSKVTPYSTPVNVILNKLKISTTTV
jgi:hypothetical protein